MPWLFISTAFIFILFIPTGGYTNHIFVFFIGIVGVGISLILFALTATKNWRGYGEQKSVAWFFRLVIAGLGYLALFIASYYYADVQSFLDQDYKTITGVPSEIINVEVSRQMVKTITVVIDNEYYDVIPKAKYYNNIEALEDKTFTIRYLPKTKWVVDHEISE